MAGLIPPRQRVELERASAGLDLLTEALAELHAEQHTSAGPYRRAAGVAHLRLQAPPRRCHRLYR